jgi:hypothetical protein
VLHEVNRCTTSKLVDKVLRHKVITNYNELN